MNKFINFLKRNKLFLVLLIVILGIGLVGGYFILFKMGGFSYLTGNMPLLTEVREKGEGFSGLEEENPQDLNLTLVGENSYQKENFGLKIVKNGAVELVVEKGKFMEIWNKITFTAKSFSGFVSNSNFYKQNNRYFGNIVVLVPSKKFDDFINKISEFGEVENISVNSKDLSGEYVDLSSRLKVLESQRDLLLSWLSDAKDIKDMLSLRSELDKIETEIEKIKGRMNYISFHTDFSQIEISIREKGEKPAETPPIIRRILDALNRALNGFVASIFVIIIVLAWLTPWLILIYIIYLIYRRRKQVSKETNK